MLVQGMLKDDFYGKILEAVLGLQSLPWVIASDFNEVLIREDKFEGRPININKAL